MSRLHRTVGILRSLAIYHGIPWRARQLRRFYAPWVPPGGLAFDIGAHAGNRVRAFRALGARVVAIEPQPDFVRLLQALFGRDPDVTVLPLAVGRAPGQAQVLTSERTPTVSTLSADWAARAGATPSFRGVQWRPGPTVPITTLDALIAEHGEPDFVKIDVEGYELDVLLGLTRPLPALSFEYLPSMRDLALSCLDRLDALGRYDCLASIGERLQPVHPNLLNTAQMRAWLRELPNDAPSGDVVVRRVG